MCLPTVHAHRMGTWNVPIWPFLTETWGGTVVGFGVVLGLGTLDTQLARQMLGKKSTPQSWRPPLPYGRHGALLPVPPHTAISQHDAQQFYVLKIKKYYCFYYFFAILRHDALLTRRACVFVGRVSGQRWEHQTVSAVKPWVTVEGSVCSVCWRIVYNDSMGRINRTNCRNGGGGSSLGSLVSDRNLLVANLCKNSYKYSL